MSETPNRSRRRFLSALPTITVGLITEPVQASPAKSSRWAMLVDTRRCIACQACTMACSMENATPEGAFRTVVATYVVTSEVGDTGLSVVPRLCNHCDQPPCVDVCPVEDCITMRELPVGAVDPRTGRQVGTFADWTTHPNNPMAKAAE